MKNQELTKYRSEWNNKLAKEDAFFTDLGEVVDRAYADNAIPKKYKELMGLAISVVVRCNECILSHIQPSVDAGASRREIVEALTIGVAAGGGITYANARFALEMLEEMGIR